MAIVAVLAALAIIAATTVEFSTDTTVEYQAAVNARDDMRAYFLARSGMNLSRMVLKLQKRVDASASMLADWGLPDLQLGDYVPLMLGAFTGKAEEVSALAGALGVPPGAEGEIKGLGLPSGEFDIEITTEDNKINVNCAGTINADDQRRVLLQLTALVSPPAYDRIFEERDGDGQFTDRATFVKAIVDYIDPDVSSADGGGQGEDYGYGSLRDKYQAKDRKLDSVEELQLVRGMDDRKWAIFGGAFTVYGGCKVNLSAVTELPVIMGLLVQAAKNPNDPVLRDIDKLLALALRVAQAKALGMPFVKKDFSDFIGFVKDPDAVLQAMLMGASMMGMGGLGGAGSMAAPLGPPMEGLELERAKLDQIATVGGRRTFRVTTTARQGRVEKRLIGVWDTETQNQNIREGADGKGAWVYWREE